MAEDPIYEVENASVLESLFSDDEGISKDAAADANDYLRTKAREDGIMRAVLPPDTVGVDDLDPQIDIEAPTKIFEKEPYTPPCVTIPFGTEANVHEIAGNRGLVAFHKITTEKHRKDKFLLMQYKADIRQIITDNDLKEILEEEDVTTFATIDQLLGGSAGTAVPAADDNVLWESIPGGLTPETWVDMMQILPRTPSRFRCHTVVMNQVLAEELTSWDHDELGQEILDEVNRRGWTMTKFKNRNLIITIKRNVVGDNEVYMFAAPSDLGKFWILQDVTMYPEAKGSMVEWYSEETLGITLQPIALAKATLTGV